MIVRFAVSAVRVLRVTDHCVLPDPPHPTSWAVGVGGAVTEVLRLGMVARPFLLVGSWTGPDDPDFAGTGFWPGDAWPFGFVQV